MRRRRLLLCTALLLALLAARLLVPSAAQRLRQELAWIVDGDREALRMTETMGRALAEGGLREELIAALAQWKEPEGGSG